MQLPLNLEEEQDSSDPEEIVEESENEEEQPEQAIKTKISVEEHKNKLVDIDGFWL